MLKWESSFDSNSKLCWKLSRLVQSFYINHGPFFHEHDSTRKFVNMLRLTFSLPSCKNASSFVTHYSDTFINCFNGFFPAPDCQSPSPTQMIRHSSWLDFDNKKWNIKWPLAMSINQINWNEDGAVRTLRRCRGDSCTRGKKSRNWLINRPPMSMMNFSISMSRWWLTSKSVGCCYLLYW